MKCKQWDLSITLTQREIFVSERRIEHFSKCCETFAFKYSLLAVLYTKCHCTVYLHNPKSYLKSDFDLNESKNGRVYVETRGTLIRLLAAIFFIRPAV